MITHSDFKPAWWLPGPHLQTLYPNLLRRPKVITRRERLELPDGDFLDLDWTGGDTGPLVLVLHGLEGSIKSPYASGILQALHQQGLRAVLMHFRGCSGEPNRLDRSYHSGETGDLNYVIGILRQRLPGTPLGVLGYSLGGNVLLKWLGEQGAHAPVTTAVAVSVPFELHKACARLEQGFSRLYQWSLMRKMRRSVLDKFSARNAPLDLTRISRLKTFREFDDAVTAPLHGFRSADEYYKKSSSRQFLKTIGIPTLILHAVDDPFMTTDAIPEEQELSGHVHLELHRSGGHVGFVGGKLPWKPDYWLEKRITTQMKQLLCPPA